jgi:hypothetical protein
MCFSSNAIAFVEAWIVTIQTSNAWVAVAHLSVLFRLFRPGYFPIQKFLNLDSQRFARFE